MKTDTNSSNSFDSTPPRRPGRSPILEMMKKNGTRMTRENYLALAYMDPTYEPEAEEEAMIPVRFRKWSRD
jgi:hypothetical protein